MVETIVIKELKVKFISSKADNYDNMISYFKIVDPDVKKKLKLVNKMSDTLYKPIWITDDSEIMLKIKTKHIKRKNLIKGNTYISDIELVPYFVEKTANELRVILLKLDLF